MTIDHDDNVVPFPRSPHERAHNDREAALEQEPVRPQRTPSPCRHDASFVDMRARTVNCRRCGVALDPIDVLHSLAVHRERLIMRGRALRHEVEYLTEQLDRLKRLEVNAKARIRTARKRRDDRHALIAAAEQFRSEAGVQMSIGGYRGFDDLSEPQREVVLGYVRQIVEAYRGAIATHEREEATA